MAVETQITRPAPFVETLGEDLAQQVVAQTGIPIVTGGIGTLSKQAGETDAGFKARQDAARAFTTRQQNLAGLAPTVAAQDALQQQAQALATGAAGTTGLASFQPFLNQAQQEAQLASGLGTQAFGQLGTAGQTLSGIPTGAQAFQQDVQQFMSPFQSQVIDASLATLIVANKCKNNSYEINKQNWECSVLAERECNSLSLAQGLQENEHYYKLVFCNKVFNKRKELDNKTYKIDLVLVKHKQA